MTRRKLSYGSAGFFRSRPSDRAPTAEGGRKRGAQGKPGSTTASPGRRQVNVRLANRLYIWN